MYDLKIANATIITGDGGGRFSGGVAVKDGRIAAVGSTAAGDAKEEIDARGHVVCPGFVDIHTHCLSGSNANMVYQGVTLALGGNCGFSPVDIAQVASDCRTQGVDVNLAMLIGQNNVRLAVMGNANRPATADEIERMKQLVAKAMDDGAMGFSTGLAYVPGNYTPTEEIVALAKVAGQCGGIYTTHMRNEAEDIIDAIDEALHIGKEASMPVEISHLKVVGVSNWGRSAEVLAKLDKARTDGQDVSHDQYPYTASCGRIYLVYPAWAREGTPADIVARLKDPEQRKRIKAGIVDYLNRRFAGKGDRVMISTCPKDLSVEGKTLDQIAKTRGLGDTVESFAEVVMALVELDPEPRNIMGVMHQINEDDIVAFMRHEHTVVGSDAWAVEFDRTRPHPRLYGTFPRVLGYYCRELGVLSLEQAIRKMTSQPAKRMGLTDRGVIAEGAWADIVMFDPDTIIDNATFVDSHQHPTGIDYVIINGVTAIDHGQETGAMSGVFVARQA